jgi:hypothetical protein
MAHMRTLAICSSLLLACTALAEDKPAAKDYEITSKVDPGSLATGAGGKLSFTITPKGSYHMKNDTPFKATLTATGDLKLAKAEFTAKDFDDPKAPAKSISTAVTAGAAGDRQVSADLMFFMCTEEICQRFTEKVALTVKVTK